MFNHEILNFGAKSRTQRLLIGCLSLILASDWLKEALYSKTHGETSANQVIKQKKVIFNTSQVLGKSTFSLTL